MRQLKNFVKNKMLEGEKRRRYRQNWKDASIKYGKCGEMEDWFPPINEAQLPNNDAIKALHENAKEEHNKACLAWEWGRKTWGSRKADMSKPRGLWMTITTMCRTMVKGKRHNHSMQSQSFKVTKIRPSATEATPMVCGSAHSVLTWTPWVYVC